MNEHFKSQLNWLKREEKCEKMSFGSCQKRKQTQIFVCVLFRKKRLLENETYIKEEVTKENTKRLQRYKRI